MRFKQITKFFLLPFFLSILTACVNFSYETDVSEKKELWGEFIPEGEYEILRDVFLTSVHPFIPTY